LESFEEVEGSIQDQMALHQRCAQPSILEDPKPVILPINRHHDLILIRLNDYFKFSQARNGQAVPLIQGIRALKII